MSNIRRRNCFAYASQNDGRNDGRVERPNTVDDTLALFQRFHNLNVRSESDLLPVRIDVPDPLYPGGQIFLVRFRKRDILFS